MISRIGRFVVACLGCGLLGAIMGAILGALASLPFMIFISIAPPFGLTLGAIGGFTAGFIGASFGGSPGFRVGGWIGALVSVAVYPFVIVLVVPPVLALIVGVCFGTYLDRQVKLEEPQFYVATIMKGMITYAGGYSHRTRITSGITASVCLTAIFIGIAWRLLFVPN